MILSRTVLRAVRTLHGDSVDQCAHKLNVTAGTIKKWEMSRKGVSAAKLELMYVVYGITEAEAQNVAKKYKDGYKTSQALKTTGVAREVNLGISEKGRPMLLTQMLSWLADGESPIKHEHAYALWRHIQQRMAIHPDALNLEKEDLI